LISGLIKPGIAAGELYGALVLSERWCFGRTGYGRRGDLSDLLLEVLGLFFEGKGRVLPSARNVRRTTPPYPPG